MALRFASDDTFDLRFEFMDNPYVPFPRDATLTLTSGEYEGYSDDGHWDYTKRPAAGHGMLELSFLPLPSLRVFHRHHHPIERHRHRDRDRLIGHHRCVAQCRLKRLSVCLPARTQPPWAKAVQRGLRRGHVAQLTQQRPSFGVICATTQLP